MKNIINKIAKTIKDNQRFLIIAHDNPDGDSIGSELALGLALKSLDKDIRILLKESIPARYRFLPGLTKLITTSRSLMDIGGRDVSSPFIKELDVLFVLDTAGWGQMEKLNPEQFRKQTIVNIDHHIDNQRFGDINWVDPNASAVGEQIYNLLKKMSIPLTRNIAVCLYSAILTDTGSFQYANTTSKTHRIISQLLQCGVYPYIISKQIYENIHLSKLKLLQLALKTLKLQGQIIWLWITRKMLKEAHAEREEIDGFINYLKAVSNIKVAIVFKEGRKPGEVRVTFRSKDSKICVNEIAHQFGGGGHPAAAGCTVLGSRREVEEKVLKAVRADLKRTKPQTSNFKPQNKSKIPNPKILEV